MPGQIVKEQQYCVESNQANSNQIKFHLAPRPSTGDANLTLSRLSKRSAESSWVLLSVARSQIDDESNHSLRKMCRLSGVCQSIIFIVTVVSQCSKRTSERPSLEENFGDVDGGW